MDEDDDNWSYSFPPSTEDLSYSDPVPNGNNEVRAVAHPSTPSSLTRKTDESAETTDREIITEGSAFETTAFTAELNSEQPAVHTRENENDFNDRKTTQEKGISVQPVLQRNSSRHVTPNVSAFDSGTGLQLAKQQPLILQPAFMSKSAPADPQTTRKDASSIISKENVTNALAFTGDSPSSPSSSPNSRSDFKSSIKIWQQKTNEDDFLLNNSDQASYSDLMESSSPKIITYRKTTHTRKASNTLKLEDEDDKFDSKLYVSEKFRGTEYRYATMKRNVDFHQLFKSIDLTDRLLDDFACAISREILLQGRIYVTERCLCFNSNLLGWVTSVMVPYTEITRIDKKSTAGLFPNGIIVETKNSKHNFASFLSRDATFDFMRSVWSAATGRNVSDLDSHPVESFDIGEAKSSERRISNYIMSIDEGDNIDIKWNDDQFEDSEEELSDNNTENLEDNDIDSRLSKPGPKPGSRKMKTMRPDSAYKNHGPDLHSPTTISGFFEGSDEEVEVMKDRIEAPLGAVFQILFGEENASFHKNVLNDQGATNISDYGPFEPPADGSSNLERLYTYQRPLGYSIGPKSTKCCVKEVIEYHDLDDSIVVLSITDTPDVPSGGSFSVMTRFYLSWSENNCTDLKIAYYIKWVGRSWIKSMVEKSTLSAQVSVSKKIIEQLKDEVGRHLHYVNVPSSENLTISTPIPELSKDPEEDLLTLSAPERPPTSNPRDFTVPFFVFLVFTLLACIVYLHLRVTVAIAKLNESLVHHQKIFERLIELTVGREEVLDKEGLEGITQILHLLEKSAG